MIDEDEWQVIDMMAEGGAPRPEVVVRYLLGDAAAMFAGDRKIETVAGRHSDGSGTVIATGERELSFLCASEAERAKLAATLKRELGSAFTVVEF